MLVSFRHIDFSLRKREPVRLTIPAWWHISLQRFIKCFSRNTHESKCWLTVLPKLMEEPHGVAQSTQLKGYPVVSFWFLNGCVKRAVFIVMWTDLESSHVILRASSKRTRYFPTSRSHISVRQPVWRVPRRGS